ncbi:MAG: GTPase [Desulfurococcaceae archaeon]
MRRLVSQADLVVEVVDARDPLNTLSRRLEGIVGEEGKELVVALNKSDLIPPRLVDEWISWLASRGYAAVPTSATRRSGISRLRRKLEELAPRKPFVVAIVGFPKTGKSSLVNALKGRRSAGTSPIPGSHGYTRRPQLYRVGEDMYLIDTPGMLPIEGDELMRVIRGMPPERLRNPAGVAAKLIGMVLEKVPWAFESAYGVKSADPYAILEEVARSRGWFYRSTGEPLIEEAARAIIRDFHKGKIPFFYEPPGEGVGQARDKGQGSG